MMAENETKLKSQLNKTPGKPNILDAVMASSHPFDFSQQNNFGLISPNLQQTTTRNFGGQQFPGILGRSTNHLAGRITPTSSGMSSFQSCLPNNLAPQQASPNSPSLFSIGSVSHLNQRPSLGQELKRMSGLDVQFGGSSQSAEDFKRERNMLFNIGGSPAGSGISNYSLSHNSRSAGLQNSFANSPALDLSEFPSLTNRSVQENAAPGMAHNPMAGKAPYVGMVKQPTSESNEFHIHSEDFPALPGSQTQDSSQDKSSSHKTSDSLKDASQFLAEDLLQQAQKRSFQTGKGSHVTSVPSGVVTDQFGMVGLLSCVRMSETDPKLVSLALGTDLTTLGMNLNTQDYLYSSFASPWSEHPCRPQDVDFYVPSEYLVNQNIRDKLAPIKLKQYGDDLLFYLFYNYSGDIMQMAAASELYNRNWRFHKEEKVWITKVPGVVPTERTATYERSMYYFFDPETWRKVAKEFHLEYDRLEDRAMTPPAVQLLISGQPSRMA